MLRTVLTICICAAGTHIAATQAFAQRYEKTNTAVMECTTTSVGAVLYGREARVSQYLAIPSITYTVLGGGWRARIPRDVAPDQVHMQAQHVIEKAVDTWISENRARFAGTTVTPLRVDPHARQGMFRVSGIVNIPHSSRDMYGGTYTFVATVFAANGKCLLYSARVGEIINLADVIRSLSEVQAFLRTLGLVDVEAVTER